MRSRALPEAVVSFYLAAKNVSRKKERSILTIIGVMLAVGSFIALLSIAEGLYNRIQHEMNGRSVDIYVLPRNALAMPVGPIAGIGASTESIPDSVVKDLNGVSNVEVAASVGRFQQMHDGRGIVVWAIDPRVFSKFLPAVQLTTGRFPTADSEIMIGYSLAQEFQLSEGQTLNIADREFKIVGVFSSGGGLNDYFCYVVPEAATKVTGQGSQEVWIKVKEDAGREVTTQDINNDKRFTNEIARTREQFLGAANDYINYAWLLQFAVAAIGMLIAMTAAMNTMLMSTYERLKEFATLRAIGASRMTVLLMIITESVILSVAGGLLGVVLGFMGSRLLDSAIVTLFKLTFPLAGITVTLILDALALSLAVGVVGAVIPCIIIYRMNIISGLRQD